MNGPSKFAMAFVSAALLACFPASSQAAGDRLPDRAGQFLQQHCIECHDADSKKGGLDLTQLKFDLNSPTAFAEWVKIHDRVNAGEMPPKDKSKAKAPEIAEFLHSISEPMIASDQARQVRDGRATLRRLNRFEYENTLRDLLDAPWLQISQILPEDGESNRFNKIGDAMDVSHVQMSRYLSAADYGLRQVLGAHSSRPETSTKRYYARQQGSFIAKLKFGPFNQSPERAVFPLLGHDPQLGVIEGTVPVTAGPKDPVTREKEAFGVVASSYEPIELRFEKFKAPVAGHYKLRLAAYSFWAGPGPEKRWWRPDRNKASAGHRDEPVTIYSETIPRILRLLGSVDVQPEPSVQSLDVYLLAGETIRVDAARLFRSRPPNWHNPLATKDGQPGVAFKWLEVEGPIYDQWPMKGERLCFGDLPVKDTTDGGVDVVPRSPHADAEKLLRNFINVSYRRPVEEGDVRRFMGVIDGALKSGADFSDAMIAGYSAVLCSPAFIFLDERPGKLDDIALAERLSYFIWNSRPDATLRELANANKLHQPDVLAQQTERLLNDPKSRRFVDAFLDYWLDLRRINATAPDGTLYPDYYLDDLLLESSLLETQLFFKEMLSADLPARNVVQSDFAMLNERLARHYGLPVVKGVALRKVKLPADTVRGGIMTQASVLKVTANGTTTSPVLRGAWVMERILGTPPPKPPPSVPAIEPDTRGATTIRQQLEAHRTLASCSACHAKIDPAGFALESFDVFGGWRNRYRGLGDGDKLPGFGKNGQPFTFHAAQPVDATGVLPDGRAFKDIRDLKKLLLADERQLARNMARQLTIYATGAPITFGDRPRIEKLLDKVAATQYGVRSIVKEIVQSELFQYK